MSHLRLLLASLLILGIPWARAGELSTAPPESLGLSAAKLDRLRSELQKLADDGKVPGGVAVIARHGKAAYVTAFGYRNIEKKLPMTEDTIFAIASMSKPITCVGVMILVEQGKLALDDPVAKYIPELKDLRVLGDGKDDTEKEIATVPAKRAITVRDLLSHTSGFSYGAAVTGNERLGRSYARAGVQGPQNRTIADQVARLARAALAHHPGEGWTYGLSHDVLGRLIEVISGQSFDAYLREHVLKPLDMPDTSFFVPRSKWDRQSTVYRANANGALVPLPVNHGSETFFSGGGGLFSTARDYTRFAQMLANGGELDGVRILKPETIAAMTTNQIGKLSAMGMKYGLGFGLLMAPGSNGHDPVLNRYFWGGFYSTNFWVDPRHEIVAVLMTQVLPTNHGGAEAVFRQAVDSAIIKEPNDHAQAEPIYPVKVSPNHRYFVDQKGKPVFWLGTTQWQLFREYSLDDARTIIEKSKQNGFAFAQVMLMGVGDGTKPNIHGAKPWFDDNPLTPNGDYFKNVDAVMQIARENNFNISMTFFHQRYRKYITLEKARAWSKWVASRYKEFPNIVWSMTPEAKPEFVPILRELAAGLHEGDGGAHLITFKPDPAPYSSSFIHGEPWLDFDSMQTWKSVELIYPFITRDYHMEPAKPVLMAEGAYEHGSEYGFDVTPLWIRRQAYYSYLAGASHTYGHNDSWRVLPSWKQALDAAGARQLGILRKTIESLPEWWNLVPDPDIFDKGGNTQGQILNLAARHKDGKWVLVYMAAKAEVSIKLDKIGGAGQVNGVWFDPQDGKHEAIGKLSNTGTRSFTTPDGWEDALLILEAEPR
jgi:CubicO group peptidase (beta-lactamase class C family)